MLKLQTLVVSLCATLWLTACGATTQTLETGTDQDSGATQDAGEPSADAGPALPHTQCWCATDYDLEGQHNFDLPCVPSQGTTCLEGDECGAHRSQDMPGVASSDPTFYAVIEGTCLEGPNTPTF
jgi:hypothetical protein